MATAQRGWDNTYHYHYHRHYDRYESPYFEIQHPNTKVIDIIVVEDDYTKSLERLHLFEPIYHLRPIYLPTIHLPRDVYVEYRYPYPMEDPIIDPYRRILHTTTTVTYKTKILPVRRYDDDENKETDVNTNSEDTKTKTPNNDSKINTIKKQGNVNGVKPEPAKKPEPVKSSEPAKKPDTEQKVDIVDKINENKVVAGSTDTTENSAKDKEVNSNPKENNDTARSEAGVTDTPAADTTAADTATDVTGEATA